MLLWISCAVLTAAAFAVVLRPAFIGARNADSSRSAPDLAVYRDQLAELDRQLAAAQLGPAEHDALRVEVSRRILRLEGEAAKPSSAESSAASQGAPALVMGVAALAPLAALGLYLNLGAPAVPAQPYIASPAPVANSPAANLIAQVEARLAANPNDGRGWDVIAPVYFKLERFADAAQAYQRAIALQGETVPRLAGFAEATVLSNDGIVTEPARAAYEKLSRLAPDRIEPRFWLALAKEQDGQRDAAAADYRALLASSPPDASTRALIEQRLAAVTSTTPAKPRGPSAADVDAASSLSETDRKAMIGQMVANLAARLKTNNRDLEGWQRLITAYVVLKDAPKARAALADARAAFQGDNAAVAIFNELSSRVEGLPKVPP
jgi:cytochrome c-type biogenesis protein CcmH